MKTTITVESPIIETPRVAQVRGLFDLPRAERCTLTWNVDLPLEQRPWQLGLVVGPSERHTRLAGVDGRTPFITPATAGRWADRVDTASGGAQPLGSTVAEEPGLIVSLAPAPRIASVNDPSAGTDSRSAGYSSSPTAIKRGASPTGVTSTRPLASSTIATGLLAGWAASMSNAATSTLISISPP